MAIVLIIHEKYHSLIRIKKTFHRVMQWKVFLF